MEGRRGATKAGKIFKNSAAKRVLPSIFFSRWVVFERSKLVVWMVGPGTPVISIGLLYMTPLNYRGDKNNNLFSNMYSGEISPFKTHAGGLPCWWF